jgi:sugar phosphate isomerase/epimerase
VTISVLGYYPNPQIPDESEARVYIDHLKQVIRAAELLGVDMVTSFTRRES